MTDSDDCGDHMGKCVCFYSFHCRVGMCAGGDLGALLLALRIMQYLLMNSKICLLFAGPTGTESLKNLVLPGCGHVTVVDGEKTTEADVGNNFFVDPDAVGRDRAAVVLEKLLEMNPDVSGTHRVEDPITVAGSDPGFFTQFDLVIATQMPEDALLSIAAVLWERRIPLIVARTYGLLGYVRLVVPEHRVIESKPDHYIEDLRLHAPFPQLQEFADRLRPDDLPDREAAHVPWPILLIQQAQRWKETHDGKLPQSFQEKNEFREQIAAAARTDEDENYKEAVQEAFRAAEAPELPMGTENVLEDPSASSLSADAPDFWFLVAALKVFMENEGSGSLPLTGNLPDMTATTEYYIELQRIYQAHAAQDLAAFKQHLKTLLESHGREASSIPDEMVERFVKNSPCLECVRFRSLHEEYALTTPSDAVMESFWEIPEEKHAQNPLLWYVLLRAVDQFQVKHGKYPGSEDSGLASDAAEVHRLAEAIARTLQVPDGVLSQNHAEEITRYGACEPHAIAAVVGGVVSQEAVKLITHQFLPFNNTLVFNGIASVMRVGEM